MNKEQFEKLITTDACYRFIIGRNTTCFLRHKNTCYNLKSLPEMPKPGKAKNIFDYFESTPGTDILTLEIDFYKYTIKSRNLLDARAEICEKIKFHFMSIIDNQCKAILNGHFACLQTGMED